MTVLFWSLGVVALLVACRYVPGFKCVSYCRYKTFKGNRAKKKLKTLCEFVQNTHTSPYDEVMYRVSTLNVDGYSSKQLLKLYKNTLPFGCNSFDEPSWLIQARELLKNRIAELQLLEA